MDDVISCELVKKITKASSVAEAWNALRGYILACGFDHSIFGTNRMRRKGVFGERENSFFLSDLPPAFMKVFWEMEHYKTIPVALWAAENTGAVSLSFGADLYHSNQLPSEQKKTQELFMQAGITSGYVIALHPENSAIASILGMVNFGMPQEEADKIWAREKSVIEVLSAIFYLKVNSLPLPLKNQSLTERQSQVLKWIGQGKTMQETATILGISRATVEKHLRQARETLGVATTTQAVLHAQINSHIFSVQG